MFKSLLLILGIILLGHMVKICTDEGRGITTAYTRYCIDRSKSIRDCPEKSLDLEVRSFRADYGRQTVVTKQGLALPNCVVFDSQNWTCASNDLTEKWTMKGGDYFYWEFGSEVNEQNSMPATWLNYMFGYFVR